MFVGKYQKGLRARARRGQAVVFGVSTPGRTLFRIVSTQKTGKAHGSHTSRSIWSLFPARVHPPQDEDH